MNAGNFERELGYVFRARELFDEAVTHSSYANESGSARSNERLEFLGDAVLELCVSETLFSSLPEMNEGGLSKVRAGIVRETALALWARGTCLPRLLKMSRGLEIQGGRDNPSILADAVEAVLGAVFLDGGYEASRDAVRRVAGFGKALAGIDDSERKDAKSELQEFMQARGDKPPVYRLVGRRGPDHAMSFDVEAVSSKGDVIGSGSGGSIKAAEFAAARAALSKLNAPAKK
jgi:ribonuclease-3